MRVDIVENEEKKAVAKINGKPFNPNNGMLKKTLIACLLLLLLHKKIK